MAPDALSKMNTPASAVGLLVVTGVLVSAISYASPGELSWVSILSGCLAVAVLALVFRLATTNKVIATLRDDMRCFDQELPVMVAHAGANEVIRSHNRAFRDWLRLRRESVNGRHLREVMGASTYQQFKPAIDLALQGRFVKEKHVHTDSDRKFHLYVQSIPQKNDKGQVVGVFLTLTDVAGFGDGHSSRTTKPLPTQRVPAKPLPSPAPVARPAAPMPAFAEKTMMFAPSGRVRPPPAPAPSPAPARAPHPNPAPPKVTAGVPDLVTTPAAAVMDLEVQAAPNVPDFITPAPARTPIPMETSGGERQTFVKTMTEELTSWKNAGDRLRSAIENDEFCLYAQAIKPIGDAKGQTPLYELLLRLQEEEDGLMPPGAFIPIAEEYGMLPDLDRWVLKHILTWASQKRSRQSVIYSVNVSSPTLASRGFPEYVALVLKKFKLSGSMLCFEIAEQDAIANVPQASGFIEKLAALGCHTAICGFGQAAGSYTLIKHMPVDYIKIDGAIVLGVTKNAVDLSKLKAIAKVARATNRHTVAEFVETDETIAILKSNGVDLAQGFGIAKPFPLAHLT